MMQDVIHLFSRLIQKMPTPSAEVALDSFMEGLEIHVC